MFADEDRHFQRPERFRISCTIKEMTFFDKTKIRIPNDQTDISTNTLFSFSLIGT